MNKLFGTDGIRGRAGAFPLNSPALVAIGQAIGERLRGPILVGQDTRISSPWIYDLLEMGALRSRASIENLGVIPTPAVALLVKEFGYAGGVMISASHNPYEDNGLKIFGPNGAKLDDTAEAAIETRIFELLADRSGEGIEARVDPISQRPAPPRNSTWIERYEQLLLSRFPPGTWLNGTRVVMDCANGAVSAVAPQVFRALGAEVRAIHAAPSGTNINAGCGSVHLEALADAMRAAPADLGIAFDGDGDRALFASASGAIADGDRVLFALARRMKRAGLLHPPAVVGTLMTNFGLEKALGAEGIALTRVSVGDRFIFEEMRRNSTRLGGEPSGHIILPDFGLSGDGLLTALKVAQVVVEDRAPLDDWMRDWTAAPQLLQSVRVAQRKPLESAPTVQSALANALETVAGRGRVVVRYSGTETVLRVMIESDNAVTNVGLMNDLLAAVRADLG